MKGPSTLEDKVGSDMNFDHLRYFLELTKTRHYTKAAEHLCISQPSLSHAIRQLEQELGVPLFEKSGRNTTLTRFGEEFADCAGQILSTLENCTQSLQLSACGGGMIRLGFLRILGIDYIPRLAARFLSDAPNKEIQFSFHSERTQALLDGLISRSYDMVFCSQPPRELDLDATPVAQQELVLITPKNHPLSQETSIDLAQAAPYPIIYFAKGSGLREVVDRLFHAIDMTPQIAYETEEDQVVAGLVAQGFGIAVVPYMDLLQKLDLCVLPIRTPQYKRELFLVYDSKTFLTPAAHRFRQYVIDHVAI